MTEVCLTFFMVQKNLTIFQSCLKAVLHHPQRLPYVRYANIKPTTGVSIKRAPTTVRILKDEPLYSEPAQLSVYKSFRSRPLLAS